ncbi:MAG: DUF4924 family protein [Bacteroides sp.]|nr:DUF4924 family protein [Bacteroides sp.]
MFTASQKKRENIAEYLLYMWQIEDLIRAYDLDIDRIDRDIIEKHTGLDDAQKKQMREWYESLIDMMRREGVDKRGHLQLNKNVIIDLEDLTKRLLADNRFQDFSNEYYRTLPYIVELRAKAGEEKPDEIEACFNALYGLLMLRLSGKEVTPQTLEATTQITKFLAMLAKYYKKDYNNELFTDEEVPGE